MATFTWKDVDDLLVSEGLYMDDDERRKLANDPDTAYSIAKKKQLYKYAATDADKSKIHSDTETLRNQSGYSMGADGATFSTVASPSSFSSGYTADVKKNYDAAANYGDFTYDAFDDKYASKRAELLDAIANPTPFSYDYSTDPVYQSYAKQYRREGERASQDALAKAAATTGGRASTAAVTAAAQAGNYYGAQLADKIPELYDKAYNRWLDEFTMKQNALVAYQGETEADYDRYTSERSFAKGVYDDKYSRLIDAMNNAAALEGVDYDRHIDNITYNDDKKRQELENAIALGTQVGDTSALGGMGYDTTFLDAQNHAAASEAYLGNQYTEEQLKQLKASAVTEAEQNAISMAELKAAMGDYTDLARLLGVPAEQIAAAYAKEVESGYSAGDVYAAVNNIKSGKWDASDANAVIAAYGEDKLNELIGGTEGGGNGELSDAELVAAYTAYEAGSATVEQIDAVLKNFDRIMTIFGDMQTAAADDDTNISEGRGGNAWRENDYDSVDYLIPEAQWTAAKYAGNKSWNIANFETYKDYVNAYEAAVSAGYKY